MCRRGVQRVQQWAVCAGEECRGYDSGQYVQERSAEGMTVGSMCRRGVWRVWQWAVCTGEECGGYESGGMCRRGVWWV
ncbi:unnamed protein product [Staurois parvus]|uniref:Uncharacterized protein n=1 Tax=Staurois parvus TaxID=386267 RepID=A0ABN9B4S5_9NEOB|nr:unnamed protein product [Staurois parvus]